MNLTHSTFRTAAHVLSGGLLIAVAGCTTYVREGPPAQTVYAPPPYVAPPPVIVEPQAEIVIRSDADFYQPLQPYGEWLVVGSYGRCWRPAHLEAGWRPYANGHWQRTDAGWFWVSSEPWGWATYHYGRWDWTPNYGWIWVPQTEWAPSWVAWREGDGYVGWAPLPPTATIAVTGDVVFRDPAYAPRGFVFVQERHLLDPVRPATVIVNNTTVINKTVNITKIRIVNKTVINDGPRTAEIERASGRRIQEASVRDLRHKEEVEVVARRQELRRNFAAPAAAEPRREPEPAKAVQPRGPTPVERVAAPETKPAVPIAHENRNEVEQQKRLEKPNQNESADQKKMREAGPEKRPRPETPVRNERRGKVRETRQSTAPRVAQPQPGPEAKPAETQRERQLIRKGKEPARNRQVPESKAKPEKSKRRQESNAGQTNAVPQ